MKDVNFETNRAWIEINLKNLENNIIEVEKLLSKKTKIMAVVKANAYGHGAVIISKKLESIGISYFAVATLDEGIELRKNGIKGNILILGFTKIENLKYVIQYNLIQTIVDYEYSEAIKKLNLKEKLNCHIKINTGMNRIGENFDNLIKIISIYKNEKLNILGTYSHLCVADSSIKEDINFTKKQISCFDKCINFLKENGFDTGIIHLQSSYGAINYSELNYDYIRLGICMYGVNSSYDSYQLNSVNLKPVLSLKARITTIKEINKNDSVSYGRTFISKGKMRIATIAIGYADGIPRNLSNQNLLVEVNGKYFNSIGRICMDQMIIDISNKQNIKVGNVVTLIGADRRISAEKMALKGSTITNELLSRLGSRLNRVIVK